MRPQTLFFLVAVATTLAGVWLRWHLHHYQMRAEDSFKDGKLTHTQVVRRMAMIKQGSRLLTFTGMILLLVSILNAELS